MQDIWWWIQTIHNCSYSIYRTTKQESLCLFWRVFLKKTIFVFIFIKICCVFLLYVLKHKRDELLWTKTPMIKKICFGKLLQFLSIGHLLIWHEIKTTCCIVKTYAGMQVDENRMVNTGKNWSSVVKCMYIGTILWQIMTSKGCFKNVKIEVWRQIIMEKDINNMTHVI